MTDASFNKNYDGASREALMARIAALEAEVASLRATPSEEDLLDTLFDRNPNPIVIADAAGYPQRCNAAVYELLGSGPPAEYSMFSDPIFEKLGLLETLDEMRAGKSIQIDAFQYNPHEVSAELPDRPAQLQLVGLPCRSASGPIEAYVLILKEISAQKQAEEDLERQKDFLEVVLNSLHDAVFVVEVETGHIISANGTACEMFGYSEADFLKLSLKELSAKNPEFDLEAARQYFDDAFDYGPQIFEWMGRRRDGSKLWVEVNIRFTRFNGLGRFVVAIKDISERKRVDAALEESKERYRRLTEDMPAFMNQFLPDSTLTYVNKACCDYFNASQEALLGKRFLDLLPEDSRENVYASYMALTPETPVKSHEHAVIRPDGTTLWQRWTNRAFFDEEGKVSHFQSVGVDITDLVLAEKALADSENKFHTLFNNLSDAVFLVDVESFTILEVNDAALQNYGYTREEMIGLEAQAISAEPEATLDSVRQKKSRIPMRLHKTKTGRVFPVEVHAGAMQYQGREVYLATTHDISSRLRAEEERLEMERRFLHAQKLESLGVLAGGIAHDFNNLLQALMGNIELAMLDLASDSEARKSIENARQAAEHAAKLTHQMLAYSGQGKFVVNHVDLNTLVQENIHMLRSAISRKVELNFQLAEALPEIEADTAQLQQVIMNLITNAAEALEAESGQVMIRTGVDIFDAEALDRSMLQEKPEPGRYVWLEVRDNGCGMTEETLRRIFDPFYTTKFTGRGLGMAAVQGIILGHKGAIMVETEVGVGSSIQVLFPVVLTGEEDWGASLSASEWPVEALDEATSAGCRGTILVVDDEQMIRDICNGFAMRLGFTALNAGDGEEALHLYQRYAPEICCVILDVSMPNMDGFQAFKELHALNPTLKVIMSSGFNEEEFADQFREICPAGFIHKPYSFDTFQSALTYALEVEDT